MKRVGIEQTNIESCVAEAQRERVILTRNGNPIALVVRIDGLDEEQIELGTDGSFWELMEERRRQPSLTREELDRRIGGDS